MTVWKFLNLSFALVIIRFGLFWYLLIAGELVICNIYLFKFFVTQRWDILDISQLSEHLFSSLILTLFKLPSDVYSRRYSIITFILRTEVDPSKCKRMRTGGRGGHVNANVSIYIYIYIYIHTHTHTCIHKLHAIITTFFVSFIKTPVLLNISISKKWFLVFA